MRPSSRRDSEFLPKHGGQVSQAGPSRTFSRGRSTARPASTWVFSSTAMTRLKTENDPQHDFNIYACMVYGSTRIVLWLPASRPPYVRPHLRVCPGRRPVQRDHRIRAQTAFAEDLPV